MTETSRVDFIIEIAQLVCERMSIGLFFIAGAIILLTPKNIWEIVMSTEGAPLFIVGAFGLICLVKKVVGWIKQKSSMQH